jgi:Tfp pilus assembly protein PilX
MKNRSEVRFQRGVVLFIALIVLVAMSLAGIALMRNVDTGTVIAGNLAFRQAAVHAAETGIDQGFAWLRAQNNVTLGSDNPGVADGNAYYAQWALNHDLLGNDPGVPDFDWGTTVTVTNPAPPAGYSVQYVIHRLCNNVGPDTTGSTCTRLPGKIASAASSTKGAASFGVGALSVDTKAIYRITAKATGPRNTVSYVQAIVY